MVSHWKLMTGLVGLFRVWSVACIREVQPTPSSATFQRQVPALEWESVGVGNGSLWEWAWEWGVGVGVGVRSGEWDWD